MRTIHNFIREIVPDYINGAVLDVGGGEGRWKTILSPYTYEYKISDLYSEEADFKDDARALSNPDNSFENVFCFEVLEHIDDIDKVISELYRVLKPNGYALATVPFMASLHNNPDDYRRLTPQGLEYHFRKAGFEIVESGTIGNILSMMEAFAKAKFKNYGHVEPQNRLRKRLCFYLHQILKRLNNWFPQKDDPRFFTHSYIVARKVL